MDLVRKCKRERKQEYKSLVFYDVVKSESDFCIKGTQAVPHDNQDFRAMKEMNKYVR